jgi:hypothetical protein
MSQILSLLTLYYLCDQAAAVRGLTADEVDHCMANYEVLKLEFIDEPPARLGSAERAAQIRLGYQGFKAWEAANADRVQQMRDTARRDLIARGQL